MAEDADLSRTEPASPRRLHLARSAGDVPRSAELSAWAVLLVALGALAWSAARLLDTLQALSRAAWTDAAHPLSPHFVEASQSVLWALLPVLVAIFIAALVAPMLLSGWVYAPKLTQVDLTRANPFKPLARLFSADAAFDGAMALLKLALVAVAVGWAFETGWPALQDLAGSERSAALDVAAAWIGRGVLALAAALVLAAALDAGWRWWRYLRRHAMTWQEVLAEAREAELPPEVQAQLRARQQQAGQGPLPLSPNGGNPLPLAGAHPEGHKETSAGPRTIDEVIG